jgi:hypothetical protein
MLILSSNSQPPFPLLSLKVFLLLSCRDPTRIESCDPALTESPDFRLLLVEIAQMCPYFSNLFPLA